MSCSPLGRANEVSNGGDQVMIPSFNSTFQCMMQSWYLAADMQMFWVAPFVLYPLWRWPIVGYIELFILLVLSIAAPFFTSWYYEIAAPIPLTSDSARQTFEMGKLYLPTYTKFTSYVVGIFIGYVMYNIRSGKWEFKVNKTICWALWLLSAVSMLYAVFGGYPLFQLDYDYNQWFSAMYIGFYRLLWSFGLAWIILACDNGWGGPVEAFLSWEIFGPLGKLTYCIYLVHIGVMLCTVGAIRQSKHFTDLFEVHDFLGDMVLCVAVAAVFSLLLEAPLMTLEKLIFEPSKPRKRVTPVEISPDTEAIMPSAPEDNGTLLRRPSKMLESTDL